MSDKDIYVWATQSKGDNDEFVDLFMSKPIKSDLGEWYNAPDLLSSPDIKFGIDKPVLYKLVRVDE